VNVRHYPGGLLEWYGGTDATEPQPAAIAPPPEAADRVPQAAAGVAARPGRTASASTRLVDVLSERSVGALFRLWFEVVLGCGLAYWIILWLDPKALTAAAVSIRTDVSGLLSAIYFSAVTATSVGYGDIVPSGLARVLAIAESIAGLILFGCVVSKFISHRQETLIAEIHRIAFEDRLGRVRTNLLLVRAELQATARLCEGQAMPPREALARVESAAMVFVGELRAVHDLLYRPQEAPEETVLEAILAGLTSVFREFLELLTCVQPQRDGRSAALAASLSAMSRLAREICGDCVPHIVAPSLRMWMDEIQRMAADAEQI
jgi:hypothetical protein